MPLALVKDKKSCTSKRCEQPNPQPIQNFYTSKNEKDGFNRCCKACNKWYSLRTRARYHKDALAKQKEYRLKTRYGVTTQQWDAMFVAQDGCCKICGNHSMFLKKTLHTDHCHKTGVFRGLLCEPCNLFIGFAKDDISILESAIAYLEKYNG